MRICWPLDVNVCEKSPLRCGSVGTVVVFDWKACWRKSSSENRKDVLSFRMGPLSTPPYLLRFELDSSEPPELEKNAFPVLAASRRYAHRLSGHAYVTML